MQKKETTSWEPVEKWYQGIVGETGHYYHQHLIIPQLLKFLEGSSSLLDLACGNGMLAHHIPSTVHYQGVDIAPSFIKAASTKDKAANHHYLLADITKPFKLGKKDFSHATLILAAQNLEHPIHAFKNAALHLKPKGKFILVINHPCFRIPRQSSWEIDKAKKLQYRRIDRYMTSLKIPIQAHPGKDKKEQTLSFHYPLSSFINWLQEAGFSTTRIEEWCSPKVSQGGAAKMENFSRNEFPLFMAIVAELL